jgi:hypothetical protein
VLVNFGSNFYLYAEHRCNLFGGFASASAWAGQDASNTSVAELTGESVSLLLARCIERDVDCAACKEAVEQIVGAVSNEQKRSHPKHSLHGALFRRSSTFEVNRSR